LTATDLAVRPQESAIPAKLAYARELANSGLLPASYRKQPANVLWAMEYGEMLGLAPMAAMTGVHVIDGKPTASAGLISGLVRQAGHQLRVWGDGKSATCEITRSDDRRRPFTVTWTLKKDGSNPSAEEAKLLSKDVWQKYPASMLKSRAITQCARDACEEVLFGLSYTPEELGADVDEDGVVIGEVVSDTDEETPPAEDRRPWHQRALDEAKALTTEVAGQALWREAAAAVIDRRCTPGQATHIQNSIRRRIDALREDAAPVEAEDLARQAAAGEENGGDGDE
jgi:hypothetical protein